MKILSIVLCFALIAAAQSATCESKTSFKTIVHGGGAKSAKLEYAVDFFRDLLGGKDNGSDIGPKSKGQRSINWDAPIVPFTFPRKFFSDVVTRGLTVSSDSNQFLVSDPTPSNGDKRFSTVNKKASKNFKTFSPKRLFTVIKENVFQIRLTIPGKRAKALTKGFGIVFVDVDKKNTTKMQLYDIDDCLIAEEYVEPNSGGLSFLGFYFREAIIARVIVTLGDRPINKSYKSSSDVVVCDDFIYGEPQKAF
mmetsp:Transcript_10662/g.15417  ORF Transcript_10662/g.15417 Transcript_10662/m.15417 type:complete len:251 (-) Transcript_10662:145-897(-)